jgi:hypothetical protein
MESKNDLIIHNSDAQQLMKNPVYYWKEEQDYY